MPLRINLGQQYSRVLMILLSTIALAGCSFFGGSSQDFTVSSSPTGATVRINGQQIGVTPLQHQVPRRGELLVEVEKPGYKSQFRQTSKKLSGLGIADVVGGSVILLPLIGLVSPGAWEQDPSGMGFSLDPDMVSPTPVPTPDK